MAEEFEVTEEKIAEEAKKTPKKGELLPNERKLMDIAEVRMVLYVVPVATALALFVYLLNSCSAR